MSANSNNNFLNSQNRTCEPCRRRKIRCNKELPCSNCIHRRINCTAQNRGRGRPMKLLDTFDRYEYNQNEPIEDFSDFKSSFDSGFQPASALISIPEDAENPYYGLLGVLAEVVNYELCPAMIKYFILILNLGIIDKQEEIISLIQSKITTSCNELNYPVPDLINPEALQQILAQMTKNANVAEKNLNATYIHQTIISKTSFNRAGVAWCIRIVDNRKHELYYIINDSFKNIFFSQDGFNDEKIYENILPKIVHSEYHQLFFHTAALSLINSSGESSVVVQCIDKVQGLIPCQINFHILGVFPYELSCCAMEFLPLTPLNSISNPINQNAEQSNTFNSNERRLNSNEDHITNKVLLMLKNELQQSNEHLKSEVLDPNEIQHSESNEQYREQQMKIFQANKNSSDIQNDMTNFIMDESQQNDALFSPFRHFSFDDESDEFENFDS